MAAWQAIAIGYFTYLGAAAITVPRFGRARLPAVAAALAAWALLTRPATVGAGGQVLLPALVLVAGYRLSGTFFVRPMPGVEAALCRWDAVLLDRCGLRAAYRGAPGAVRHGLELAYLLAYPMVPAGALALVAGGHAGELDRFWSTVLLAAFTAYGALPWVQTRPPRALVPAASSQPSSALRRLNGRVLDWLSVGVNTIPSGHAAAALAVALAVGVVMPLAGLGFLVLALLIVAGTVLGGYHYAVDSALGAAVALAAAVIVRGG